MIKGKKLFITGGAGFIGTSLIKRLIADNEVIVYDSLSRNALKDSGLWNHLNLKIIQGDILDYELPVYFTPLKFAEVVLEDGCDIGAGAIILPGVRIGEGAIVGAGAVVTCDVPPCPTNIAGQMWGYVQGLRSLGIEATGPALQGRRPLVGSRVMALYEPYRRPRDEAR